MKEACVGLVCEHWIPQCGNNPLMFLECLDVLSNTEIAAQALRAFFSFNGSLSISFDDLFMDNLTPECALLMRICCEFYSASKV